MWPWSELCAWSTATSSFWPSPPRSAPGPGGPPGNATLCSQQPLPCAEDGGTLQAAAQTFRQTGPHIQTGQAASGTFGDMAWVDWTLGWGWMCQWPCRACLPPRCWAMVLLCLALFLSIAVTNKGLEEQSGIFLCLPNHDLKSWEAASGLFPALDLSSHIVRNH